jgi:integrase
VPLGKLNTERMVPLDEETVALIDRIVAHRSPGRPLPHPHTARPTDFLLTHHGRRLTVYQLPDVMTRVTRDAGQPHITPHQLRHTYATALVNAGVSLQSLMTPLGHVSAEMSLRSGRLFDSTVRTEYERALTAAKAHLGTLPTEPPHGRPTADHRRRLETHPGGQGSPCRWLLHPRPRPGPVRLRQYL